MTNAASGTGVGALGGLQRAFAALVERVRALETNDRAEVAGGVQPVLFAALPAAGQPGRLRHVLNGRKPTEGAGAGTGVLALDDGVAWRRVGDYTTVAV